MSSVLRVGFIGLSTSGWAPRAHLPYLKQNSKYVITGVCNTSKASAENAIKHHDLPTTTKAYSSYQELADDPEVDLVVVSVRTDYHGSSVRAALEKGKSAYVEWPLGKDLEEARELLDLAKKHGSKTMVGLQARRSPEVNKIKQILEAGTIGKVLSSSVTASAGNFGATEMQAMEYFNDPKVGGNIFSIHFGHMIDYVLYALGPLASYKGNLSTQRKETQTVDTDGKVLRAVTRGTPDTFSLQGTLKSGADLTVYMRGGKPFKGEPGLLWRIYGEKGEIQVTSAGVFFNVGYPAESIAVKVHNHEADTVEQIDYSDLAHHDDLPLPAKNVAALYEAFADERTDEYVQWDEAVTRHELLHNLAESSKSGARVIV